MKTKRYICKFLAAMLAAVMMFTTLPQSSIVAYAVPNVAEDEVEESVKDETVDSETEMTEDEPDETEPAKETIEDSSDADEEYTDTDIEDEEIFENVAEGGINPEMDLSAAAGTVPSSFSDTTPSVDNLSTECWSWDLETRTLTLDGADIAKGIIFYCDANINVLSDSSITASDTKALFLSGSKAKNLTISGSHSLRLETTYAYSPALSSNNDGYEHNITISGSGTSVECINNAGESAIYVVGGCLTVEDGAVLSTTSMDKAYAVECFRNSSIMIRDGATVNINKTNGNKASIELRENARVDVLTQGKLNVTSGYGHAVYMDGSNGVVNVSGEGSAITANYTDSWVSNPVIAASGDAKVNITDGGKLVCNDVSPKLFGLVNLLYGDVDIRGGIISAQAYPGQNFGGMRPICGETIQYDENGLFDSAYNSGASYYYIDAVKSTESFFYGNLLNLASVPKEAYGVKSGNTATMSVLTEVVNTSDVPSISYQWYKDGVKVAGATTATYTTPALSDGVYTYKCEVKAVFPYATVTLSTGNSKVYVNSAGRTTVDTVLTIDNTTESVDKLAEDGYAWDNEEKKLTLNDAAFDRLEISGVAVTIENSGNSIISTETGTALFYEGKDAGVYITGDGTLTFENRNSASNYLKVIEGRDSLVGPFVISGDSITVNCNSVNGIQSAFDINNQLEIKNGATLNVTSTNGKGIHVYKNGKLYVNTGSRLNIFTGDSTAIQLQNNSVAVFTDEGTEVVLDSATKRTSKAIGFQGDTFDVVNHARLVINKCKTDAYEELDSVVGDVNLVGGVLEFNAPLGETFPAGKSIIRAPKDRLFYNEAGVANGYFESYTGQDHLRVKTAAGSWIYTGDKPYINITKQPVNKYIVNGNTATLDVEAELIFGGEGQTVNYQWYKDSVAVLGATEASFTTEQLTDVSNEYYCVASATVKGVDISVKSEVVTVQANFSGKATRRENLDLRSAESVVNELEGWSWDSENKVLTLEDYTQRMTVGNYGITIPAGTTIVLKGTNRIDMESYNSAIYTSGGSGKVIITGDGTLDITCVTNYGIHTDNGVEVLGTIEIGDLTVTNKSTGAADIKPVLNSTSGFYEVRIVTDNEPRILFEDSEKKIYTSSLGGIAPKITVDAKLMGATGAVTYQYQWYSTDEWDNPYENAVPVAKGKTLTAPVNERGGKYYYCEVTATYNKKQYKKTSELYAVVVGDKGLMPLTKKTVLSGTSVDHMVDQGWSWDASTQTLTLKNLEAFIPFASNTSDYYLFVIEGRDGDGINVVLINGSVNHISECCYGINCSYGNAIEFSGNGTLNYESGPEGCLGLLYLTYSFENLIITDGPKLNVYGRYNALLNPAINIRVDNAEATFDYLFNSSYGRNSNVYIGDGGVLNITGPGEKEAKGVTVDVGGALYLSGSGTGLVIDRNDGVGELTVNGILSIASDSYAMTIFGANPETRIHISDSEILEPEGKTISELYVSSSGDRNYYCKGNLLIAPSGFSRTPIKSISDVSGVAAIGSTLTAGDVLPLGATVSYTWQHAISKDTPDALWSDTGITGKTFSVDDIYAGEYIRVKATGNGKYSGTVYSKPTMAVATTDVSLADFVVEDMHYGRLSTTYTNYPPSVYYPASINAEVYVKALPDAAGATVTIKNITSGFTSKTDEEKTINGSEGILPIYIDGGASTTNDVEITVTNGSSKAVYKTRIDYRISSRQITLSADDHCTLVLMDSLGSEVLRADSSARLKWTDLPAGEEYTLTAISEKEGWYVSSINCSDFEGNGELVAEKRVLKFTVPNTKGLVFDVKDSELRCVAPSVNAYWEKSSPGYCIAAKWDTPLPTVDHGPGFTGRISAEIFDEDGNELTLKAASIDNPQGFSTYFEPSGSGIITLRDEADNELSFDSTKNYTLRFWYDAGDKQVCDVLEVPISGINLSMNKHHIVIEKPALGETEEAFVNVKGRAFKVQTFPETPAVTVEPAPEGGYVNITVSDSAEPGTVYALMYVKKPDGKIVSEPLSIDVIEPEAEITAGLSTVNGLMNIYSDDTVIIPINVIGSGKSIVSAKFVESNNKKISDLYVINVFGDREVEIVPVNTPDTDETDWAAVAKSYAGSFKAKIEVELEDGNRYVTKDYFALTVKAAAPKVSATAIKLNSFYQGDRADLIINASGAITDVKVDEVKSTSKAPACPAWINLEDADWSVVLDNSKLIGNKGSGKLCLKVWLDGYRMPAQISVPVSAAYGEPKLKLDKGTLTLPADHSKYNSYATVTILSNTKNMSLDDINITNVRVATPLDLAALSAKDKDGYANSKYYKVNSYDPEKGEIKLDAYTSSVSVMPLMPAGKILMYAEIGGNKSQKIALPLTIKTENDDKVAISMSQKSITLNSNKVVGTELIKVNLVPSASGYDCSAATVAVTDAKGNGDYSSELDINRSGYEYTFATNSYTRDVTYKVKISVPGISKPATLDVIVKKSVPKLASDKKTANIDVFGDYKESKKQTMTLTLSDATISRTLGNFSYRVFDSAKKSADGELDISFAGYSSDPIVASIGANSSTKLGKYTVELIYTMPGSGAESVVKIPVNVTGKLPTIKPSKTSVTLNSSLGKSDMATVTFNRPDAYSYAGYSVNVFDKKNAPVADAVICDYDSSDGVLTMYPGAGAVPGDSYKVKVGIGVRDANSYKYVENVITVKMVAKNRTTGKPAITQKVATKGKLELARSESELQIIPTYTGWNGAVAMGATEIPEVTWTIYAYKGKIPYQHGNPSYQYVGSDGKVACSTRSGSLDWFIDIDDSDAISLKLNPGNAFVNEVSELTGLSYKLVLNTTFSNYYGAGEDLVLSSTTDFKVNSGVIKFATSNPDKITLNKSDRYDSKVVKVNMTDADALSINIRDVKMKDGSPFDATLLYVGGDYAYVAIGWENDTVPATIKAGKQTLEFYSGYNYKGREKFNGTSTVTVSAQ